MKRKINLFLLLSGILFLLFAIFISINQYSQVKKEICVFPDDSRIAQIDVANLTSDEAAARINEVFLQPIKIIVGDTFFYIKPSDVGLSIQSWEMVDKALTPCKELTKWQRFADKIFSKNSYEIEDVELIWIFDQQKFINFLDQELRPRYDQWVTSAYPEIGTAKFFPGTPGKKINQNQFQDNIINAFLDPNREPFELPFDFLDNHGPTNEMLVYQINQALIEQKFNGLVEIFYQRTSDNQSFSVAFQNQQIVQPGIAFTAASTMKIPILVSSLNRSDFPLSDLQQGWIDYMIIYSENDPADRLMEQIDYIRGPLIVTEDMQKLGLENTFIAGYFYLGAPLLDLYQTPANQRTDINLKADLYNQTTPVDIGKLLMNIYLCAENQNTAFDVGFPNMDQEKCRLIIDTLSRNQIGALIESGVPEGIHVAHKHGWSEEQDGLIHTFSDVGIVFGEEEDYVLTIFIHSQNQLLFDTANLLTSQISRTFYNFTNLDHQISWINPY